MRLFISQSLFLIPLPYFCGKLSGPPGVQTDLERKPMNIDSLMGLHKAYISLVCALYVKLTEYLVSKVRKLNGKSNLKIKQLCLKYMLN